MSQRIGSEAERGNAATARDEAREDSRPIRRLAVAPTNGAEPRTPLPVEQIGALSAAELAELSPPDTRGVQSGAFSKRFGEEQLDWSALRNPTPLPPPPAAEPVIVPSAVQPFYGWLPSESERAELRIADLRLDIANPFLGSSLMPPPPKKRPWLRPLLITVGGCLLIGAGYAGAVMHVERTAFSAVAKWMGEDVSQRVAIVVQAPLQAATEPSAAEPTGTPNATPETTHALGLVSDAVPSEPQAVEPAVAEPSAEPAVAAEPSSVATPVATPKVTAPRTPRGRRRAALANRVLAPSVASPAASNKVLEAKPAAPSVTAPAGASAARAVTPTLNAAASTRLASGAPENQSQDLSRAQVQTGLESVRSQLQSCAAGTHGRTTANVTISGAGRVTYATIEGAFAGTPQGSCMARALRGAQFPQFASPQLRVRYPFAL